MRRLLRHARPAAIQARLYNLGRYPGVVAAPGRSDRVYGRVIPVKPPHLLKQLDRYEDYFPTASEFIRVMLPVHLSPSRKYLDCWVYVYNRDVDGKQRILSGDYVRYRQARRRWRKAEV